MHVKEQQAEFGIKIREEQPTITKKSEDNNYEYKTIQKIEPQQSKYDALINLENYVLFKKAKFLPLSKYYKIKDKTTGDIFLAQMTKPLKNENYSQIISDISLLINTLSKLNHPCLIKYIGYSPFNFKYKLNPIIITEHAKNFNLIDFLKNEHIILEHKLIIIYGIASGMSYLHLHNIIHPDLKPSNILIDSFLLPKIVNYSNSILLSKITNKKKHRKIKIESKEGKSLEKSIERTNESETIDESRYLAPETLEKSEITESSNVYSFGCIAYDIIDDVYKFSSNKMKVYNFNSFSRECKEIIEKSMSKCPQDRPTFDEIISKLKDYEEYSFFDDNLYDFHGYIKYIDESKNNNNKSIGNFESGTNQNRKTNQNK